MHFTLSWSEWTIWNIQSHENGWSSNLLCWKLLFSPETSNFSGQAQLMTHKPKLLIYKLSLLWVTAVILGKSFHAISKKTERKKKIQRAWRASLWNLHLDLVNLFFFLWFNSINRPLVGTMVKIIQFPSLWMLSMQIGKGSISTIRSKMAFAEK